MILSSEAVATELEKIGDKHGLIIAPEPDLNELRKSGAASVDLRLGTWFVTTRISRHALLDLYANKQKRPSERSLSEKRYVRLGSKFYLHPRSFVLAVTLEWIKMPSYLSGYVSGKSSWGRRGLVIETAPGVHPGFTGCLTLELANVGEVPIAITPGTSICQIFIHRVEGNSGKVYNSSSIGQRQPTLRNINIDEFALALMDNESRETVGDLPVKDLKAHLSPDEYSKLLSILDKKPSSN